MHSPQTLVSPIVRTLLGACMVLCLVACRASRGPSYDLPDSYALDQITRVIAAAEQDMTADGNPGLAFARLQVAHETAGKLSFSL